jgi:hypothetical protein
MWGGVTILSADKLPAMTAAFHDFNINHYQDPYGSVILGIAYIASNDSFLGTLELEYGKPVADAPILANFTAIPTLETTNRITNLSDLTIELNNTQVSGLRETWWTLMFHNDVQLMTDIQSIFMTDMPSIANVTV